MIEMAVSLPTAADVRKIREQAAKSAAERAEIARTPLLAVLGAGDLAVTAVTNAVTKARTRAGENAEKAAELPRKLNTDELRKAVDEIRVQAEKVYAGFARRGEQAWGNFRAQPQVRKAVTTFETYTGKVEARVDTLVDDAHDAAEKALTSVSRQTRSTGEKVAQATKRFSGRAAETVTEASKDASAAVADAGAKAAEAIEDAGDEAAGTTRSTTRKAANRTRPASTTK
ncbi:MAG: hypothetical protein ACT4RN_17195 [Pseudonocardia sp.]